MFDAWALAGAEVGVVFCTVVLVTGPLWGRRAWGMWWTWDARLTTTLVLWLIYVSYLLLRRFAAGPQMQTLAAVLGIFGALDVPIVYMSNRWWRTQHPAPVFGGGQDSGMDPTMVGALALEYARLVSLGRAHPGLPLPRGAAAAEDRRGRSRTSLEFLIGGAMCRERSRSHDEETWYRIDRCRPHRLSSAGPAYLVFTAPPEPPFDWRLHMSPADHDAIVATLNHLYTRAAYTVTWAIQLGYAAWLLRQVAVAESRKSTR